VNKRALILTLGILAATRVSSGEAVAFQVIVNSRVEGKNVERRVLSDIFLRKVVRWGDGHAIDPVDLSATSPVREAFSQSVLGMPTDAVRQYWGRAMAAGLVPPLAKKTDEEIVEYVATHPGSVGYVATGTPLLDSVRPLDLR
jgi:ABC-type phosphate transport system substrate-binding protein